MERFTGDYQGTCGACDEPVEFAIGVQTDRDPVAMHFGPGGPVAITLYDFKLITMIGDDLDVAFGFDCPLCGARSGGRTVCRTAPTGL